MTILIHETQTGQKTSNQPRCKRPVKLEERVAELQTEAKLRGGLAQWSGLQHETELIEALYQEKRSHRGVRSHLEQVGFQVFQTGWLLQDTVAQAAAQRRGLHLVPAGAFAGILLGNDGELFKVHGSITSTSAAGRLSIVTTPGMVTPMTKVEDFAFHDAYDNDNFANIDVAERRLGNFVATHAEVLAAPQSHFV